MPVQKRQCPPEDVRYDVDGRGARHTLFSSTAVLQAGNSDLEEVLAVVSATGETLAPLQLPICAWPAMLNTTACSCSMQSIFVYSVPFSVFMLASCVQCAARKLNVKFKNSACFHLSFIQPQHVALQ